MFSQEQIQLKLYNKNLERVECFKYLGIWFDRKLNWKYILRKLLKNVKEY